MLRDVDVSERLAIDALDVVRREQVHVVVALGELERDVRDHDAQREGLDADLLVRVLTLGVEELVDVRVVGVQVHRTGALTRTELVGVGEGVLQELHHGDDARGLVLDVLDGRAVLAQVRQQQGHTAAALGQLQGRIDAATDGLHVVLDTQQEAGHGLAALLLARIEERGRRRLETAVDDLVDELPGQHLVAGGEREGDHADAVLVALEVTLTVERLERVRGVVLERAEEGLEAELLGVGVVEQLAHEVSRVLVEHLALVVVLLHQVVQLLVQVVEEDGVLVDVLEEVLACRLMILLELDVPVRVIQVEHGVERVVVQTLPLGRHGAAALGGHCWCCQNSSNPSRTRMTSSCVPINSNR